jgi:hypothetical protein
VTVSITAVREDLQWFGGTVASMVFAVGRASWRSCNASIGQAGAPAAWDPRDGSGHGAAGIVAELLAR